VSKHRRIRQPDRFETSRDTARDRPSPETVDASDPADTTGVTVSLPDPVGLPSHRKGVPGMVWLRRGDRRESPVVGVTPGSRLDLARLTVLAVEPMVLELEGGLAAHEFAAVSAWILAHRDLIDDV
jgi:hypothetical protein